MIMIMIMGGWEAVEINNTCLYIQTQQLLGNKTQAPPKKCLSPILLKKTDRLNFLHITLLEVYLFSAFSIEATGVWESAHKTSRNVCPLSPAFTRHGDDRGSSWVGQLQVHVSLYLRTEKSEVGEHVPILGWNQLTESGQSEWPALGCKLSG